jgi:hypothetical protein
VVNNFPSLLLILLSALAGARAPDSYGAVIFQPLFLSILGKFWNVVHAIEGKFCMHTQTDEFADVSQNLS